MMTDRLAQLISRKLSGEATPEEIRELDEYLRNEPGDQYFTELLTSYWIATHEPVKEPAKESNTHFELILRLAEDETGPALPVDSFSPYRKKRNFNRLLAAAATLFIVVVGSILFLKSKPRVTIASLKIEKNELVAQRGARSHLILPDGSKVWLNSDSRLVYSNFNDSLREVELEGEAFFDVVKQPARPFIVHTSGIAIHVLGTAFNVKSYPNEPIEATLIRGLIKIEKNNQPGAPEIILHPHQKIVFKRESEIATASVDPPAKTETIKTKEKKGYAIIPLPRNSPDNSIKETSWIYNRLQFDGDSFAELTDKMERWFNVNISLTDEKLAAQRLHGSFVNETVDEALHLLQITASFDYKINGNEIEIVKK